ncbi:hypothetical protein KW797_01915 [Candidatus Parcubacteria bacterium]|nr:hypothetical protein [Candidatus Parcubacteria bacterium]
MADMHILEIRAGIVRVVFHVDMPAGNNAANVAWSTAFLRSRQLPRTILPDGDGTAGTIDTSVGGEKEKLVAGTRFEIVDSITLQNDFDAGTPLSKQTILTARYTRDAAIYIKALKDELNYYGFVK